MADDTRDPTISRSNSQPNLRSPPPGETAPSNVAESLRKTYEVFHTNSTPPLPPRSANALPEGSGRNTAGSHEKIPSLTEAVKTVRWQDFQQVHMYPCVRESLLFGIGGGFGIGGVRALWGGESCCQILYNLGK